MSVQPDRGAGEAPPHHRRIGDVVVHQPFGWRWTAGFLASLLLLGLLGFAIAVLFLRGVGIWGTNIPYVWAFDLTNYVWWIGIANAASLFASVLVLRRADWRTAVNRFAEAAALFAVICAGLFPILHLGRPELFYWTFPYPSIMGVWPQFRSPLVWDFFAILTHLVVTALFWYVGLIPDLAHLRDRTERPRLRRVFGVLALGWRGELDHWYNYRIAYKLLAALVLPLVVFMQSTVSFEFAVTLVPAWHQTRLPPYFVFSGLISGLAVVLAIALLVRRQLRLEEVITQRHIDLISMLIIANALVIAGSYSFEAFTAWYNGLDSRQALIARATGTYAPLYWSALALAFALPQVLWFRSARRSTAALTVVAVGVSAGLWIDRFMIVVGGLYRPYLPSAWKLYSPTVWEWLLLVGSIGLFITLILLFIRFVPVISLVEKQAEHHEVDEGA